MTFESLTLTPFRLEKTGVRKMVFLGFRGVFGGFFGWNQVEYARIKIMFVSSY